MSRPELSPEDDIYELLAHRKYDIQDRPSDPISFSTTSDPDTMYWHQAMQEPDRVAFLKDAVAEVKSDVDNDHFVLTSQDNIPKGTKVLASVWSMKRKQRILSCEVYKWKARLNAHGGQQEHGINLWETYSLGSELVFYLTVLGDFNYLRLGNTTNRFCAGFPTSGCRM